MMPELKVPVEPKKLATFAAGRGHFALLQLVRGAIDYGLAQSWKELYLNMRKNVMDFVRSPEKTMWISTEN